MPGLGDILFDFWRGGAGAFPWVFFSGNEVRGREKRRRI